jgi:hypothetical protein
MSDSIHDAWRCPACGRHVPPHVDTCRCGLGWHHAELERRAAERNRVTEAAATHGASVLARLGRVAFGYRSDVDVPRAWRLFFRASLVAAVGLAFGGSGLALSGAEAPPTQRTVRIVARLADYTRSVSPSVANTIPSFLAQPGLLGILEAGDPGAPHDAGSTHTVKALSEGELQKGFCSPTVALLVRQQFPGSYDGLSDAELERMVLAKYPEYRTKLCVLPPWIDATPDDIIKYETTEAAFARQPRVMAWALLVTAAVVMGLLNVYYRILIVQFA